MIDKISHQRIVLYTLSSSSNPEEIRYVGYSKDTDNRLIEHLKDVNRVKVNTYKKKWIAKELKLNNHILLDIIDETYDIDEAFKLEINYIKLFKSLGARLVNGTLGGDGVRCTEEVREKLRIASSGRTHTQESIYKIIKANTGRKASEETKLKMSKSKKARIEQPWSEERKLAASLARKGKPNLKNKGILLSEERKTELRNYRLGRISSKRKTVIQYNDEGFYKEFLHIQDAIDNTGIKNVHNVISGKRNHAGGFKWKYKE